MNFRMTLLILVAAVAVSAFTGCAKEKQQPGTEASSNELSQTSKPRALPRLVDLGRGTCIPCKQMAPILKELEVVERYLKWSDQSRGLTVVKKVCGALVILGGLYLLWSARR